MMHIRVEGVTHGYGQAAGAPVLRDVVLQVEPGNFVVVVGPSGCGKSTLLRLLAGIDTPQRGRIFFGDRDVTHVSARERNVAMVFQSYALYPHMTVRGNLELTLRLAKIGSAERERRVREVCEFLELTELLDRRPAALSGGQRQRVAMGRALVRRPDLFLFDEPLSNLDADLRQRLRAQIKALHRAYPANKVYVTHDQVEAMSLADIVVVLNKGRIEQVGTPSEIYEKPSTLFVAQFFGTPAINVVPGEALASGAGSVSARNLPGGGHALGKQVQWLAAIRPEDVLCGADAVLSAERPRVSLVGRVKDAEHLGATTVVSVETSMGPLCALVSRPAARIRSGETLPMSLPCDRLHGFDANTGLRLGPGPEQGNEAAG